jgi:hypothetical protein
MDVMVLMETDTYNNVSLDTFFHHQNRGVYIDSFIRESTRQRRAFGIEPNPMGGVFLRKTGPKQLAINVLENNDTFAYGKSLRSQYLNKDDAFDLLYSIEVCEHIPSERHVDVAKFFAGLSRTGTKLIFGSGSPNQRGTGHIGNRPKKQWEEIFESVGFIKHVEETNVMSRKLDNYDHKVNTQVYYYRR